MKVALIGYGKMGKEVESILRDRKEHTIVSVSYKDVNDILDWEGIKKADVAVDFTSPEIVVKNIQQVLSLGTDMVVGTTGWYSDLEKVERLVKKYKRGLIYASNFSIGANIFFEIVAYASKLFSKFSDYDVAGIEMHHTGKKDSPSGTARKLAAIIMKNMPVKKTLQTESLQRQIQKEELHVASLRIGRYFGRHELFFDSDADQVQLAHTAHNRRGFAQGAVWASEFIKNKKGMYRFEDVFSKEVHR